MQRRVVQGAPEVAAVRRVVAVRCVVRGDVRRAGGDLHRPPRRQGLPARRRLAGEGTGGQTGAARGPEAAGVRAGVAGALVEAHAGDPAAGVGVNLTPELDRAGVAGARP